MYNISRKNQLGPMGACFWLTKLLNSYTYCYEKAVINSFSESSGSQPDYWLVNMTAFLSSLSLSLPPGPVTDTLQYLTVGANSLRTAAAWFFLNVVCYHAIRNYKTSSRSTMSLSLQAPSPITGPAFTESSCARIVCKSKLYPILML